MLDITPLVPDGWYMIRRYGEKRFELGSATILGSVMLQPTWYHPWAPTTYDEITPESLAPLLPHLTGTEILLLGVGAAHRPCPPSVLAYCRERAVAVESMTTGAACRTYNILVAEGRLVTAALLALTPA